MSEPIFFIHVPKTAGTSFRVAMEREFSSANVISDYSLKAAETDSLVREFVYDKGDVYGLFEKIRGRQNVALTGHVSYTKYRALFPATQVLAFVRKPYERLVSEYHHFQRVKGYQDSLSAFMHRKASINKQSQFLAGLPLSAMGFVGLTEDYNNSVEMINASYQLALPLLDLNKAPKAQTEKTSISHDDIAVFEELNQDDIKMYQRAVKLYEQRKEMHLRNAPYTHGEWHIDRKGVLHGFAFQKNQTGPISVVVSQGDARLGRLRAKDFHPQMYKLRSPRGGFVGFNLAVRKHLQKDQEITVTVEDTGQKLLAS